MNKDFIYINKPDLYFEPLDFHNKIVYVIRRCLQTAKHN
jgi:hypothetical protein